MAEKNKNYFRLKFSEFLLAALILISSLMLAFYSGGFVINLKQAGFSVISSVAKGAHFIADGAANAVNSVGELRKLKKEYNELALKLENYEKMQRSNAEITKENERLKEQLGFSLSMNEKNIPAQIISRDLDNAFSYLTINKGSVNGIKKNMPVVAFQNGNQGFVGKIIQVGAFTSQIIPAYNVKNIISVRIQNTRDLGLASGLGSQNQPLLLQHIRKRAMSELSYGDVAVTSGENNNYMSDIPVGTITKITATDYNSSLNIELTPIIDFSRLENVIVVNQKELNDKTILENRKN